MIQFPRIKDFGENAENLKIVLFCCPICQDAALIFGWVIPDWIEKVLLHTYYITAGCRGGFLDFSGYVAPV